MELGTVSGGSIAAMCVTLVIALVLPVVILIVYAIKTRKQGVPAVAREVVNSTSIHDAAGLIPGLALWVKDPVLL